MGKNIFTKKELTIILMIFAFLFFAFFWYELRPYFARRACVEKAENFSKSGGQPFEKIYADCMMRKVY